MAYSVNNNTVIYNQNKEKEIPNMRKSNKTTTAKIEKETREACDQTIQQMEERLKEMSEKTFEIVQENAELKKQITQSNKIQYNLLSKIDKIDYANSPSARYEIEK